MPDAKHQSSRATLTSEDEDGATVLAWRAELLRGRVDAVFSPEAGGAGGRRVLLAGENHSASRELGPPVLSRLPGLEFGPLALGTSRAPRRARDRGAVVVLVLVTVLLAAFLLAAFIRRSTTELLADARASQQRELRGEAYSALETTLAVLADFRAAEGALRSPAETWGRALEGTEYAPAAGREVEVAFEDESAKLSLPLASETELQTLLEFSGVERNEAERLANALHAWMRRAEEGAPVNFDVPDYSRAEPAYAAAQRPLRSWRELAAVELDRHVFFDADGRPTEVFHNFTREVSLLSFRRANLNSAQGGVLTALGLGAGELTALENHRMQPRSPGETGVFRSLTEASTVLGGAVIPERFGTDIEALRVQVTVRQGAVVYRLSAVVTPGGAATATAPRRDEAPPGAAGGTAPGPERKVLNYPFTVVEIREDTEPPPAPAEPVF